MYYPTDLYQNGLTLIQLNTNGSHSLSHGMTVLLEYLTVLFENVNLFEIFTYFNINFSLTADCKET